MIQKIKILLPVILLYAGTVVQAQVMSLQRIIDSISVHHPVVKMYDNEIRSMDENAKGARSWMAPQVGVGNFMTPYNVDLWRKKDGMTGMGSVAFR